MRVHRPHGGMLPERGNSARWVFTLPRLRLDGATHRCLVDLALACSIPKLNIIVPADALETKQVMDYVLGTRRLFFVRLTRNAVPHTLPASYQFHFGEAQEHLPGQDVTLFPCGKLVQIAVSAAKELKKNGISAQVINVSTVKPLDSANLVKFTRQTGYALVAEEHNKLMGLGAQISRSMAEIYPIPMEFVGIEAYLVKRVQRRISFENTVLLPQGSSKK